MNNNTSPEKKGSIMKTLAVAGFIGILMLVAWLSVQLVHLFPSAVTSLASLADGVNQYPGNITEGDTEPLPLNITSDTSLLASGEALTLKWNKVQSAGEYIFAYECVEGVSVSHQSALGNRAIDCATNYNIGPVDTLTMNVESEKNRYSDLAYTVSFLHAGEAAPRAAGKNTVTIVNTDVVSDQFAFSPEVVEVEPEVAPVAEPAVTPEPATPQETVAEVVTTPVTPTVVVDPYTDLTTSFMSVGEIINNQFVPGPVSTKNAGAVQFAVKNIGTETSGGWTYSISLPNDNTYVSPIQTQLVPGERAIISIGFPASGRNSHVFSVAAAEAGDTELTNNTFRQTVAFVN